jgi:CheY-like chemotaxis protein
VDDEPASRLTLQTVLETCGYSVETAASAAEAVAKLEDGEFELVLSDLNLEAPEAGREVLTHARLMPYKPATAMITAYLDGAYHDSRIPAVQQKSLLIKPLKALLQTTKQPNKPTPPIQLINMAGDCGCSGGSSCNCGSGCTCSGCGH